MAHQNIPAELRALPQWVVSGSDKRPYNPRTMKAASPVDPSTWGTFDEAVSTGAPNIGFVLTREDPYCVIDLDDKPEKPASPEAKVWHDQILHHFQTYIERSVSGHGYHVLVKGALPAGVNNNNIEMYSSHRYIIFTGDVVKNLSVAEGYQEWLDKMYEVLKPKDASVDLVDVEEIVDDRDILEMATNATNADKYNDLCGYDYEAVVARDYEGDPSKADLALLSMLGFYSRSDDQVRRMFRMTPLAQRLKDGKPRHTTDAQINTALRKIRSHQVPLVDMSKLLANMTKVVEELPSVTPPAPPPIPTAQVSNMTLPPGLVGRVAQWVFQSSIRPVPEIALATGIALVAGIVGRAYNTPTRAGLSQYITLLAKTGTGKEAAASCISTLLMACKAKVPTATDFMGPSVFASGPALHRVLSAKPCFVSVLGEFGLLLQKMGNKNANTADLTLKKTLLDAYGKSGYGNILQPSVYSDKEKDVAAIASPNITILGESTPESFYDGLSEDAVTSGFLPRFFIIEYFGERPERNPNPGMPPPDDLVRDVSTLISIALQAQANNQCMPCRNDAHAAKMLDAFDLECDSKMRGQNDVLAEVWNRAHLKALKLSSLLAVGVNPHEPVVTEQMAAWAITMIRDDAQRLAERFKKGDIGEGEAKQQAMIIRLIEEYAKSPIEEALKYHTKPALHAARLVSYKYLMRRTQSTPAFSKDRRGPNEALKKTLEAMVTSGQIVEVDKLTAKNKLDYGGTVYGIGGHWG